MAETLANDVLQLFDDWQRLESSPAVLEYKASRSEVRKKLRRAENELGCELVRGSVGCHVFVNGLGGCKLLSVGRRGCRVEHVWHGVVVVPGRYVEPDEYLKAIGRAREVSNA